MDESYIQLLAAAAASMPASPFLSNTTDSIAQQALALNPSSVLQNHWLQQQYYQQLALQYLENIRTNTLPISPLPTIALPAQPVSLSSSTSKIDDSSSFSLISEKPDANTSSYVPPVNVTGIAAPIPKRPRLMLPVVNEERQLSVIHSRANEKPSYVINLDLPQPNSTLMPAAFTAFRTPALSPATETSIEARCSSSTSVDTLSNSKEEEEPELFIDIESVDNRPEGRDRRRAYIDFYRKVKSARQREPGPLLSCALCDCQILSNDNSIHTHVNHHADAGGFWCKLCGVNEADKYRIYEHMRINHPNNMELFEDRRDIIKLCAVIQECFPRTFPRSKKDIAREFDVIIKHLEDNQITELKCDVCDTVVKGTKVTMTKHAHQHPMYRCKVCKYVSDTLKAQEEHQVEVHTVLEPKSMVNYNVCGTADILAKIVHRCFAYILRQNDSTTTAKNTNQKT
ncbi:hypothetical protein KIN20_032977 [Parelaphostrongylus tenuis]|uniref:C2H2-type domain-containing protein n=1 Tax=Parelaphostrongylus tenuis TaxID=148309 RepID=A0AAD5R7Y8_PARTN|nr:hypothetical protein KIN20_032977 [Parelaphostrongylus tenuis]